MSDEELKAAKKLWKETFKQIQGITGVGIGDQCIIVYLANRQIQSTLPNNIDDIPIKYVVTGEIRACTSEVNMDEYVGKLLVYSDEQLIYVANDNIDAENWIKTSPYANKHCTFVQGPPTQTMTLQELESCTEEAK